MSQARTPVLNRIIGPLQKLWYSRGGETKHDHPESLDFAILYNRAHAHREERRSPGTVCGIKVHSFLKLLVTVGIGCVLGFLAVGLAICTETLKTWKNTTARGIIHDGGPHGIFRAMLFHCGYSTVLILIGSCLAQFWAPAAAAAGVSLVMAYLNGVAIPDLLSLRTLIAKWVGTCCSVSANLALGPEAPMIHLGGCAAHVATHAACVALDRWESLKVAWMAKSADRGVEDMEAAAQEDHLLPRATEGPAVALLHSDAERREFISAGAAAGLAAAFGAPIGGVLFSLEEASTYWSRKVAWRCFICTATAVFTLAQLHPRWKYGVLSFKGVAELSNREWFEQLPFIVLISIIAGVMGALFNIVHKHMFRWRAARLNGPARIAEALGLGLLTIVAMFVLSWYFGACVDVPEWHTGYGFTFHCKHGKFNDLATAFMSNQDETIKHIFSLGRLSRKYEVCKDDNCYFTLQTLFILTITYWVFMVLLGGIVIPGGLFMPSIMVGSSFGAGMGLLLMQWLPEWNIQPGLYAMCAAAAMLGGVFRSSISLVVIVVEGTQSTKFMLGIIIAVICSNWVGEAINSDGIYETDLEADGTVIFLRNSPPHTLYSKTAADIAARAVWCFREIERVDYIMEVLTRCRHNGFPVVSSGLGDEQDSGDFDAAGQGASRSGSLQGIILRSQILVMLRHQVLCNEAGVPVHEMMDNDVAARELTLDTKMRAFFRLSAFSHRRPHASSPEALQAVQSALQSSPARQRSSIVRQPSSGGTWLGRVGLDDSARHADGHPVGVKSPGKGGRIGTAPLQVHWSLSNGGAVEDGEAIQPHDSSSHSSSGASHGDSASHMYLDLRPFMDQAPTTVREETPAERAHGMFTLLGLRHLVVVNEVSHVRGIITRRDLDHAAGHGSWRRNKIANAPERPEPNGLCTIRRRKSARNLLQKALYTVGLASSPLPRSPSQTQTLLQNEVSANRGPQDPFEGVESFSRQENIEAPVDSQLPP
ncbi:hypothetical protein CVIRNUC_005084 [Coccomyxa viridis]|uniref:Chloride channel protein n=1 Tax=Coccomyxa viridis TaxID=1274662 RepID=A0AAV1I3H3_9CHLO|nr:hypothetical protein CVIRNUC_005084 [Coccomyxa viridis]